MAQVLTSEKASIAMPTKPLAKAYEPANDVLALPRVRKVTWRSPKVEPKLPPPRAIAKPTAVKPVMAKSAVIPTRAPVEPLSDILDRLQWQVDAPMRPPAWRWLRADWLARHDKLAVNFRDDMHIDFARRFCIQLGRCRMGSDYELLRLAAPDLVDAWAIWQRGEQDVSRANIEARILAKEPFTDIGRKLCLSEAACRTYETVFFHVTDRLHLPDFIINRVIGSKMHFGLAPEDTNVIWKMYAYFGGVHVLEDLIYQDAGGGPCSHPENVASYYGADAMAVLRRKMAIAMRTLPLDDPKIALRFLRLGARMQQVESRSRKSAMPSVSIGRDHVDAMMQQIRAANDGLDPGLPENFRAQYHAYMAQFKQQPVEVQSTCGTPAVEDDADWPFCGARDTA